MNKLLLINNTVACFDTEDQTLAFVGRSCYPDIDYAYLMKVSGTIITQTGTIDVKEGELVIKFYGEKDNVIVLPEDHPFTKRVKEKEEERELADKQLNSVLHKEKETSVECESINVPTNETTENEAA